MFIVLLTGEGEGCDYTIGCNKTFKELEATSWDEAKEEVAGIYDEYADPDIEKAQILEVVKSEDFDISALKRRRREAKIANYARADAAWDAAEFERLKAKLGR